MAAGQTGKHIVALTKTKTGVVKKSELVQAKNFEKDRQLERRTKMSKRIVIVGLLVLLSLTAVVPAFASPPDSQGRGDGPVIYVQSQGKYYDSIVLTDLPMQGRFQKLVPGVDPYSTNGLATEFGPGDVGYLGGRWWVDANGNGEMDEGDSFFLCPLLGPGRDMP